LLIENSVLPADRPIGHGYSAQTQVVLPYHGAFTWQVGRTDRLVHANAILFVTGGEEFLERHPIKDTGHGSAILTPSEAVLDELARPASLPDCVTAPMADHIRLTMHALLFDPGLEPLAREELAVGLLGDLLSQRERSAGPVRLVVERAKEVLHAHAFQVLSLDFVSRAVGVTPIYLTQTFSASEGMPLYRYQMRLRLSRALLELPSWRSLTELALDLGFSSHSHFTMIFRTAFGITPSEFRARTAKRRG
jgi:AraC-like DNA-binding protein